MESHKQSTILYSLGFIETFVQDNTLLLTVDKNTMSDEDMIKNSNENEYRDQVAAMWRVLDEGVRQLLAENGRLLNKITMAEMALKG
jgi:hypothetical protein